MGIMRPDNRHINKWKVNENIDDSYNNCNK